MAEALVMPRRSMAAQVSVEDLVRLQVTKLVEMAQVVVAVGIAETAGRERLAMTAGMQKT